MTKSLIEKENIFIDVDTKEFSDLIKQISKPLLENSEVNEQFPNAVIEREKTFPTGLPTDPIGVAIPHTDPEHVNHNKVTIAVLNEPLEMNIMGGGSDDKTSVAIIFLLALGQSNKQLNILQKLMSILPDEDLLNRIKNGTKEEIYTIAKEEIKL